MHNKLDRNNVEDIASLTSLQEGMLFHYIMEPDSLAYHEQMSFVLAGDVNAEIMQRAWRFVISKNETLRTIFRWKGISKPIQIVMKTYDIKIQFHDLSNYDNDIKEKILNDIKQNDLKNRFDLENETLRIILCKKAEKEHIMIISNHHILYDGWSNAVIMKELMNSYHAFYKGQEPQVVYKSKFSEHVKYIQSQDRYMQKEYWEAYLSGAEQNDVFYSTKSFDEMKSYKFYLSKDLCDKVKEFARENEVSIATLLYCVWGIVSSKINGTKDIMFGTTLSGRNNYIKGIESMVGLFINTIPLRVRIMNRETTIQFIKRINQEIKLRDRFESTPLVDIKEYAGISNNTYLFNSLVVFENYPLNLDESQDEILRIEDYSSIERTNYNITLEIFALDLIELYFKYNCLSEEMIKITGQYFTNVLRSIISGENFKVDEMDMLTEDDRTKILYQLNNTYTEFPRDKTIAQLFEEQATISPNNIALVFGKEFMTYKTLNEKSNQLAKIIKNRGIEKDSIVAIMAERSIDTIAGILGILKAGSAYLPIDPDYPTERINFILADSSSKILLTQSVLNRNITFHGESLNIAEPWIYEGDAPEFEKSGNSGDLAYVIYTSGSTGEPKGTLIEHKSIMRLVKNANYVELSDSSVILQTGSIAFDASTFEIWGALLNGGKLILADVNVISNPYSLKEYIEKWKVNTMWCTSTLYNQLIQTDISTFDGLENLLIGGEKLSEKHVYMLKGHNPLIRLINGYGPTENTTFTATYQITDKRETIPIGKPINNTQIYIINEQQLCGIGIPGELCIGGDGLARGYLNRPDLTNEKFIENPFKKGEQMYLSGDIGKLLPDGNIEFLGRKDNQIKIRGFRVELGEIESKLLAIKEIKEAAVIAKEDKMGDKYLCAYIVSESERNTNSLRQILSETLPDYMLPGYFVYMEQMPLTPNGKTDRKALPEPAAESDGEVAAYMAPRNHIEEAMVKIWSDILGRKQIGIKDNFFELGGHSLKATVVIARIHKELNAEIPLKELFKTPTIGELSQYIATARKNPYTSISPAENKDYYEASSAQKRLWLLNQFAPENTGYNISGVLLLEGNLKRNCLENAFKKLMSKHEGFRTSFKAINDVICQKIEENIDFSIEYIEGDEEEKEEKIRAFIRPFDLSQSPLVRIGLIKTEENKHYLLVDMHHIIADGMSLSIITREFMKAYKGEELEEQKIQYKDFSEWQNKYLKTESMQKQEEYWVNRFSDEIPVLDIPLDYIRPAVQEFNGGSVRLTLNHKITDQIKSVTKEANATLYMTLLSAINILMMKYTGQEDIIIGSPIAGRPHADLENIVGMFVNTLAMRNYPESGKSYIEFLKELKENALKAYEYQDYQFEELVEKLNLRRDISRNPLFDIMFVLQNTENSVFEMEDLKITRYPCVQNPVKFDLEFMAMETESGEIIINIEYSTSLFKEETIRQMGAHLKEILEKTTANHTITLGEIEIITEAEREQILHKFNDTKAVYPNEKTIHQLIEEQAKNTPLNTAIVFKENSINYEELNEKANQLARLLRSKKVKPDELIGIQTERSIEMIVGMLGILKSGGAYLPIDPDYPRDRITYMLKDSGARLLLTQSWINVEEETIERIDLDNENIYQGNADNLELVNSPADLAYVIYTSGSTGRPKGVMVEHRNVVNFLYAQTKFYGIDESDRILQYASISFDPSVEQIFIALCNGASCYPIEKDIILEARKFNEFVKSNGITHLNSVPSFFENTDLQGLKSVRRIISGGDRCSAALARKISADYTFYNKYGPTEAAVTSTAYLAESGKEMERSVPIGKPIKNYQVYILDKNRNLCPVGIPGELCISGAGVGRGYLNREALTKEQFIENPYNKAERLYRTGDLGRWLADGNIEFLGRIDNQVKIRGYRIELGEIENQLIKMDGIKEAVGLVGEGKGADKYLCAYYVSEKEITSNEIRQYLSEKLPDYMIPAYFIKLDKLPQTVNGKVDKKMLPAPDSNKDTDEKYTAPKSYNEEVMARIWSEILGKEKVGIYDEFFELGGDSIKAIRIISKLREAGYELSVRNLMLHPRLESVSRLIKKYDGEVLYEQGEIKGAVSLGPIQKRFFEFKYKNPNHYNQAMMLKVRKGIAKEGIIKVFNEIVKHHDMLRAVYPKNRQELLSSGMNQGYELQEYDYSRSDLNQEELIKAIEKENNEMQSSMNIETGPLMKAGLFRTKEGDHLSMCIHHLAVDGVSWRILIEDFGTGIRQYYKGEEIKFSKKTASYKAWVDGLKEYGESDALIEETAYWNKIDENIPAGKVQKAKRTEEGFGRVRAVLDEKDTKELLYESGKAFGTEINDLLLSGLGIAINKLTGQEKLGINLEGHGRERIHKKVEIDRTVGWFTSIYPIIVDISEDAKEMIIETKEMLRRIPNKGMGYGVLKYLTGNKFKSEQAQVTFNYLGNINETMRAEGEIEGISEYGTGRSVATENRLKDSISMICIVRENRLNIDIAYSKDLLSDEEAVTLGNLYKAALKEVINTCKESTDIEEIYGLSPMQEGMLYQKILNEESAEYVIQSAFNYKGKLNIEKVKQSLRMLTLKHEVLRTSFITGKSGKSWQAILKNREIELNIKAAADKAGVELIKKADIIRGFNLKEESLLRVTVISGDRGENVILWTMHHIITDGWCTAILFGGFIDYYERLSAGTEYNTLISEIEKEGHQTGRYQEYIHMLEKKDKATGFKYWAELLKNYDEAAVIDAIACDETKSNSEVGYIDLKIDKETSMKLESLGQREKVTINNIAETIWGIVLQKYNQRADVVFGKVVSGRDFPIKGIEKMVGLCINTIPLRIESKENTTVRELLKQVHKQGIESSKYDYCPLAEVQSRSELGRNLFSTIFMFENYYVDEQVYEQVKGSSKQIETIGNREQTNYGISVSAHYSEGLNFRIMYNPKQYGQTDAGLILKRIEQTAKEMAGGANKKVSEISIITEEERNKIVNEFNDTYAEYPREKTIYQLFEEQAEKTPKNMAVVFEEESMSYEQLNEKANQLARVLRRKGVKADSIVGIMVERSMEMIVGIMGILKAGGGYMPIDPAYPEERIKFMIEDSGTKIVLTQSWLEDRVMFGKERINLDDEGLYVGETANLEGTGSSRDLAYVIYTSGSTGRPKGVLIEHRSIVNRLIWMQKEYPLTEEDIILQKTTYTFDVSVWEILWWSLVGAKVCILGPRKEKDIDSIIKVIENNHITVMHFVPSMFNVFLAHIKQKKKISHIKSLKRIFLSGEALGLKPTIDFNSKIYKENNTELINLYGPTEAAVDVTYFNTSTDTYNKSIPIGKPISNTSLYILGENNDITPIGIAGELYIGGDNLARGYLNRHTLTSEKFIHNPLISGERMYRTGDLARWLPDGNIEYLGRLDHQVKIRGFRIELGEIEACLLKMEVIAEVIVIAKEDELGDKYLCAYFTSKEDTSVNALKRHLSMSLPDYMVPPYFVRLENIPKLSNGKINRKALPEPHQGLKTETAYAAPRNEIETNLAGIWKSILNVDKVGINDNFFELGGHSIKAITLINRINNKWETNLSLTELYNNPRISDVASYITNTSNVKFKNVEGLVLLKKGEKTEKNLFFIHTFIGESSVYRKLVSNMEDNYNYWGISYDMPCAYDPGVDDVEKLVSRYIEKIKKIQKAGPYYISGWCIGGIIAFEIARQLEQMKDEIKFIGLYNSPSLKKSLGLKMLNMVANSEFTVKSELDMIKKVFPEYDFFEKHEFAVSVEEIWKKVVEEIEKSENYDDMREKTYEKICQILPLFRKILTDYDQVGIKELIHYFNTGRGFTRSIRKYMINAPKDKINAKINYFIAAREESKNIKTWNEYSTQKADFHSIDADHFSMFQQEEDIIKLSEVLKSVLGNIY